MYKIKRILYIHIILIYFTFIYTHSSLSSREKAHHRAATAETTTPAPPDLITLENGDFVLPEDLTEEQLKQVRDKYKELTKELVFDLKGKPSITPTSPNSRAYVPRAILEEYIKIRDSVREIIPSDRDFYGKINIEDFESDHENFWSAVNEKFGNGIEVEMGPDESIDRRNFKYDGKATHIGHIPPDGEPEAVPPTLEYQLPPHWTSVKRQKQFHSVLLRFKLDAEMYTRPTAVDNLKSAVLHLNREPVQDYENKPLPFFNVNRTKDQNVKDDDSTNSGQDKDELILNEKIVIKPRFQTIYILDITGYDPDGDPLTRIFDRRPNIDTRDSSPILFNIVAIVKRWLMNPARNYGIIIRVTNEDDELDELNQVKKFHAARMTRSNHQELKSNASTKVINLLPPIEVVIAEHVRLRREFRQSSDSKDTWTMKQPALMVYSKTEDTTKRHVKRHHESEDSEDMQADDPGSSSTSPSSTNPPVANQDVQQLAQTNSGIEKPITVRNTSPLNNRRDQPINQNRRAQGNRSPNVSRTTQSPRSKPKGKPSARQAEKCSLRTLSINFDDVGWSSWIIAPTAYHANYCSGDCTWPLSDIQNATNHAIIQAIYHNVGRVVPRSCCAPVKLGRMAILYQLDGIVQMRQYDDMIVEACGCL